MIADGAVQREATDARRQALREARVHVIVAAAAEDADAGGTRLHRIGPGLARRLGVGDGRVLECLGAGRAVPLRGKVRIEPDLPPDRLPLGPVGRKVLGVGDGERVWVRTVPGVLYPEDWREAAA